MGGFRGEHRSDRAADPPTAGLRLDETGLRLDENSLVAGPGLPIPPDFARHLENPCHLGPLIRLCKLIALNRAGESALRAQAQTIERHVPGRFVDAARECWQPVSSAGTLRSPGRGRWSCLENEPQRLNPPDRASSYSRKYASTCNSLTTPRPQAHSRLQPPRRFAFPTKVDHHGRSFGRLSMTALISDAYACVQLVRIVARCRASAGAADRTNTRGSCRRIGGTGNPRCTTTTPRRGMPGPASKNSSRSGYAVMSMAFRPPEVTHRRRRNGDLRRLRGFRPQESEVFGLNVLNVPKLAGDCQARRRKVDLTVLRAELRGNAARDGDALEALQKVDVKEGSAEFPSVTLCSPIDSCFLTTSRIASSSIALRSSFVISFFLKRSRASFSR